MPTVPAAALQLRTSLPAYGEAASSAGLSGSALPAIPVPLQAPLGASLLGSPALPSPLPPGPLISSALPKSPSAGAMPDAAGSAVPSSADDAVGVAEGRKTFDGAAAPDFGARGGTEIANKDTILSDVDRALGRAKPPALEYFFVRPLSMLKAPRLRLGTGTNPYGHAAVRYTLPDGTQKLMNIVGDPKRELVNFLKPQDYIYGTRNFDAGSEQGGVYNRGMVTVRIEELPAETLRALDRFYTRLQGQAERGEARFSLVLSKVRNVFRTLFGGRALYGNCALWTSRGLAAAKILHLPSFWPKSIWVTLYETYKKRDPSNVHVVSYRRVRHARRTYGTDAEMHGLVAPLRWFKSWKYWELDDFADVSVEVPDGTMTAVAAPRKPQ